MEQEQVTKKSSTTKVLGYYIHDNTITLELEVKNTPEDEGEVMGIHFSKHFVKWMHEEFDRWSEREENQVEVKE